MISRRIFAAVTLLCLVAPVHAQKTKSQIDAEITTNFPDNNVGAITPQILRGVTSDIVNSIMPTAPVVSGNLACFNGTTGLLQDCGSSPTPNAITALTGDGTATGPGSVAFTLATVNSNTGSFGSATNCPSLTVNGKGLTTAASQTTCTPAITSVTGLGSGVATFLQTPSSANLATSLTDETGTGSAVFANTPTITTPNTIGIVNGGNAAAGSVGEYIESVIASGSATSLTSTTPKNITSITLTAGDWDVSASAAYASAGGVSVTFVEGSISTTTGTVDQTNGRNTQVSQSASTPGQSPAFQFSIGPVRFNVTTSTTVFLVSNQVFTVGTLSGYGLLRARRIR
jgi:hypothetical protein